MLWALLALFGLEIAARAIAYRRRRMHFFGRYDLPSPKALAFQGHPYALYVKKANASGLYPSNSMGYAGKREFTRQRDPGSVRLYCVGGSTTEQHDTASGSDSSWPGKLQDALGARFPGLRFECINAAAAGYTSAESLAEFIFRGIDLQPDILIVYHNVNDAWTCQMVDGFRSDYSHARRHKPWRLGWANRIPQLPWVASYQFLCGLVQNRLGRANALIEWIADPPWHVCAKVPGEALFSFRRNIITLVAAAHAWSCVPVLLKWECDWTAADRYAPPYYNDDRSLVSRTYYEIVRANNETLQDIAAKRQECHYFEVGPFAPEHFTDTVHFSAVGLDEMARRVADRLAPVVETVVRGPAWHTRSRES